MGSARVALAFGIAVLVAVGISIGSLGRVDQEETRIPIGELPLSEQAIVRSTNIHDTAYVTRDADDGCNQCSCMLVSLRRRSLTAGASVA